jgi:hypothetical protein
VFATYSQEEKKYVIIYEKTIINSLGEGTGEFSALFLNFFCQLDRFLFILGVLGFEDRFVFFFFCLFFFWCWDGTQGLMHAG